MMMMTMGCGQRRWFLCVDNRQFSPVLQPFLPDFGFFKKPRCISHHMFLMFFFLFRMEYRQSKRIFIYVCLNMDMFCQRKKYSQVDMIMWWPCRCQCFFVMMRWNGCTVGDSMAIVVTCYMLGYSFILIVILNKMKWYLWDIPNAGKNMFSLLVFLSSQKNTFPFWQ